MTTHTAGRLRKTRSSDTMVENRKSPEILRTTRPAGSFVEENEQPQVSIVMEERRKGWLAYY